MLNNLYKISVSIKFNEPLNGMLYRVSGYAAYVAAKDQKSAQDLYMKKWMFKHYEDEDCECVFHTENLGLILTENHAV